jgi:lysozyme
MSRLVVDLSSNNKRPDFKAYKKHGVEGVILKATEGAGYNSSWDIYSDWAPAARAAGLRVGAYHYAKPSGGDARLEARNFAETIRRAGGVKRRDFRPALDLEETAIAHTSLDSWVHEFNDAIRDRGLPNPMFYSYPYFIGMMHAARPLGNGLWLASYGSNNGQRHPYQVPYPWKKVHMHQYTSRGSIAGQYPLDLNYIVSLRAILAHPITGLV